MAPWFAKPELEDRLAFACCAPDEGYAHYTLGEHRGGSRSSQGIRPNQTVMVDVMLERR